LRAYPQRIDNTFHFSAPADEVQKQLDAVPSGRTATLEYRQKYFALAWPIPFFCVRRTQYEIVGVRFAPANPPDESTPATPQ